LKTTAQQIEGQAKKERSNYKKQTKKNNNPDLENQYRKSIEDLKLKQDQLLLYWDTYKDIRLSKWLKMVCATFDAQKEHYSTGKNILSKEEWKAVSDVEPQVLSEPAVFTQSLQSPPQPPQIAQVASFPIVVIYFFFSQVKPNQLYQKMQLIPMQTGRSSKPKMEQNIGSMRRRRRANGKSRFDQRFFATASVKRELLFASLVVILWVSVEYQLMLLPVIS